MLKRLAVFTVLFIVCAVIISSRAEGDRDGGSKPPPYVFADAPSRSEDGRDGGSKPPPYAFADAPSRSEDGRNGGSKPPPYAFADAPSRSEDGRDGGSKPPPYAFADAPSRSEDGRLRSALERGEIVRLHILAEDDTDGAQRIKLAVRDAVTEAFGKSPAPYESADEAYEALSEAAPRLQRVALKKARDMGFEGEVACEVGVMRLPEKRYGNVTLPEGDYRALRITIGRGEGRNWWCILYPSLCLAAFSDEYAREAPRAFTFDALKIFRNWLLCPPPA